MEVKSLQNLGDYFVDISLVDLPLMPSKIFNNPNENILEIGFGEGEFLIDLAVNNTGQNFIGLEIKRNRFLKAARKACNLNLKNIKFIHIDASLAIKQLFACYTFSKIYINFPDPWPKLKHHKHRLFNTDLLLNLYNLMIHHGHIYISSDHQEYILKIIEAFEHIKKFRIHALLKRTSDSAKIALNQTRFEREFINMGRDIYYLNFIKI